MDCKTAKGFTLFTALIAFVLIILALLLVQSMVSTQRSTSEIISNLTEQKEMQSIADLSRSDALQVVNYGIRFDIESYSTKDEVPMDGLPDNTYFMNALVAKDWPCVKKDFLRTWFGIGDEALDCGGSSKGKQVFASIVASHLENLLETTSDTRGYSINIAKPDTATLSSLLNATFESNFKSNPESTFEVIGCDPGSDGVTLYKGCNGSFYITIDLSPEVIDATQYEKFPQVRIENLQTGRVLKEPVMPRGKNRIYVPTRLFKALAGAREIGFSDGGFFTDTFISGMPKEKFGAGSATSLQQEATAYAMDRIKAAVQARGLDQPDTGFALLQDKIKVIALAKNDDKGTPNDASDDTASLISVSAYIFFEETNPKYKVSTKLPNVYGIQLYQNYAP